MNTNTDTDKDKDIDMNTEKDIDGYVYGSIDEFKNKR